jgi:hypothetical protein
MHKTQVHFISYSAIQRKSHSLMDILKLTVRLDTSVDPTRRIKSAQTISFIHLKIPEESKGHSLFPWLIERLKVEICALIRIRLADERIKDCPGEGGGSQQCSWH